MRGKTLSSTVTCLAISLSVAYGTQATETLAEKEYVNSIGMKHVRIEPGTFEMGSATGDFDEQPVHHVTISKSFFMSNTEVTNSQYEQFDPNHKGLRGKLGFSTSDNEAVVFVTWHEAMAFCRWLSEKEGKPYRLPTEAEWEYACRAGTTTAYHTGDELPGVFYKNVHESWYPDPSLSTPAKDIVPLTVANTPANAWGLFDMHGNVEEWCLDWYGPYEKGDQTDSVGRIDGDCRVTRGGSHSTALFYLRSANRMGTLPEDKSWLIGFRVVQGDLPMTKPPPVPPRPLNQHDVSQKAASDAAHGPDPGKPYFEGPRTYVKIPLGSDGPMFYQHNHDPAITECPNGDLLAIWYSCRREPGRELAILASRLRHGATEWEAASPFWDVPDRNDHAPALYTDEDGTIYHFNGLSAAATWGNLAVIMRTSTDSGATWSKARLILPDRGTRHLPVESVFRSRENWLILPCDVTTQGRGGTAIYISRDGGKTWTGPGAGKPQPRFIAGEKGAWIAGIHAGLTQLKDGRLLAFGREDNIDDRMPMSVSADMGHTWSYSSSPFQSIAWGQRLVLTRLREGPIFLASFGREMMITDVTGQTRPVSGLFGALSLDEGKTWPICRLISDDGSGRTVAWMDGQPFTMSISDAEPKGYLSVCQTPRGVIHLISSRQHYAFNLQWLKTLPPANVRSQNDATRKRASL